MLAFPYSFIQDRHLLVLDQEQVVSLRDVHELDYAFYPLNSLHASNA